MTLSDLQQWRKRVPFFILGLCVLPWFLLTSNALDEVELPVKIIVPGLALAGTFFYVGLGAREARWKREMDTHVGSQIRTALLTMVPSDLEVTDTEKYELAKSEIYRKLTGVFWEAIDRNQVLKSHKEHFYSNGIVYSTTIDVFLICGFAGFSYAVASLVLADTNHAFVAASLLVMALVSRLFALPHVRQRHMSLSAEQLDLLRREESDFVSGRFRDIVVGWRRARLLP